MKFITKIQSIADLITNSSSEAFVMREDDAKYFESLPTNGCVDIYAITEETIRSKWYDGDLICNFLGIEPFDSWTSSVEEWNEFVDVYIMPIIDKVEGFYSTGEPTIHPEFCEFLETVFNTGVVPNYTTNGISIAKDSELSEQILEHTRNYVGGVAVSMGNKKLYKYAVKAINKLICFGNTNVNIHHIISDKASVNAFINEWKLYGDQILYHVLLPLMPSGRSTQGVQEGVFEYLENEIERLNIKNVAFGAHFIDALQTSKIKTWLYPAESLSKNIILTKDKVQITPSSFNLNPIKTINL